MTHGELFLRRKWTLRAHGRRMPEDAAERFIDQDGVIRVTHDDLEWVRIEPA